MPTPTVQLSAFEAVIQAAKVIADGGGDFILVLVCIWLGYLYRQEREENRKLNSVMQDNSREIITAMVGVEAAIMGYKEALLSMHSYLKGTHHALSTEVPPTRTPGSGPGPGIFG